MSKIIVAHSAGFCHGVKRAVEKVFTIANNDDARNTVTLGPVVHNPQVLEQLDSIGIASISDPSEAKGKNVVVRAHGITPQLRKDLRANDAKISDATCPDVGFVHGIVKKHATQGYATVVVGDKNHAEIKGVLGFSDGKGYAIDTIEEVKTLPELKKVCIVSQTTHQMSHFQSICNALIDRFGKDNCSIFDTICQSTKDRQNAVETLAEKVDIMVVIGGKNSANTHQLVNLSRSKGTDAVHVANLDDLNAIDLSPYARIGVTAGASTPNWMIKHVVLRIQHQQREKLSFFTRLLSHVWDFIRYTHIITGVAAGALSLTFCTLVNIPVSWKTFLVPVVFITGLYILNSILRIPFLKLNEPPKFVFYEKHKSLFKKCVCLCGITALALCIMLNTASALAMVSFVVFAFAIYKYGIPWKRTKVFKLWKIQKLPGSKDAVVLLAWIVPAFVIPLLGVHEPPFFLSIAVCTALAIPMVFIRSVANDTLEMHEDLMVGSETLPMAIGEDKVIRLIMVSAITASCILILATSLGFLTPLGFVLLLPLWGNVWMTTKITSIPISLYLRFSDIVDLSFIFSALLITVLSRL